MKSTFLKVMGILCIIFGAIATIVCLIAFPGYKLINDTYGVDLTAAGIVDLINAIVTLLAGILGCAFCSKVEKAIVCRIVAIVMIVCKILSFVMANNLLKGLSDMGVTVNTTSPVSLIIAMVLPILYFIATFCYKQKN